MAEAAPTISAPSKEWQAYAPTADRRLVLSSIDSQLNRVKSAWREKYHSATNNGSTDNGKEEFYMNCMDETASSLKNQLEQVTIPMDEAEVESKLEEYQHRHLLMRDYGSPSNNNHSNEDDSISHSSSSDEEMSNADNLDFDDDEIIDQQAYEKVKELRNEAREIAGRVISVREEALERALGVTSMGLTELLRVHGFKEDGGAADGEQGEGGEEAAQDGSRLMDPMNAALRSLTLSLQNVDGGLVNKLELLKETIGTIDSSIDKYQRVSQGDENVLSQTEKALLATSNVRSRDVEEDSDDDGDGVMDPDKKLARLLAGVL